jgi:hypothetical protein
MRKYYDELIVSCDLSVPLRHMDLPLDPMPPQVNFTTPTKLILYGVVGQEYKFDDVLRKRMSVEELVLFKRDQN